MKIHEGNEAERGAERKEEEEEEDDDEDEEDAEKGGHGASWCLVHPW